MPENLLSRFSSLPDHVVVTVIERALRKLQHEESQPSENTLFLSLIEDLYWRIGQMRYKIEELERELSQLRK